MITIHPPRISEVAGGLCRLSADFDFGERREEMWLEVPEEYASWLCADRCDAFLVAVIYFALINNEDIVCKAPVSEELLYKLREYLINGLLKADASLKKITITAEMIPSLPAKTKGAVVTGMSCGIDSLHALAHLQGDGYSGLKPTHLIFNKVGAQHSDKYGEEQHRFRIDNARALASEQGLPLIEVESNVQLLIPLKHIVHGGYRNAFVILAMQRGISAYFLASSRTFAQLDLTRHREAFPSYDLVQLDTFSTPSLQFYSAGANISRFEKTAVVSSFPPSYKYLNVCFWVKGEGKNCTIHCEKCQRTILQLEALGCLDRYGEVFDLELYRKNRKRIFRDAVKLYARGKAGYKECYQWLCGQMPFLIRLWFAYYRILDLFRRHK